MSWLKSVIPSRIKKSIKNTFLHKVWFVNKEAFKENAVFLFSDPRSGSTWLVELFNRIPDSIIIDEPLSLTAHPELLKLGFSWRQYIPEHQKWSEAFMFFSKLVKGIAISKNCFLEPTRLWSTKRKPIFKIIRGKLLLAWMLRNFQFKKKPIVLVRHPLAVIDSMKKHPSWDYSFERFQMRNWRFPDKLKQHEEMLKKLDTKWEQLLAYWCISNIEVKERSIIKERCIIIFYEDLLEHPIENIKKLFKELNVDVSNDIIAEIWQPSSTSLEKEDITFNKQIDKWKEGFSASDLKKASQILEYFEVDFYSVNDVKPIYRF